MNKNIKLAVASALVLLVVAPALASGTVVQPLIYTANTAVSNNVNGKITVYPAGSALPAGLAQALAHSTKMKRPSDLQKEVNGYRLAALGDFQHTWALVTVRMRPDVQELRFVYANPSAMASLTNGTPYRKGAIFAKIGIHLGNDPMFTSSLIPIEVYRYSLMVMDKGHKGSDQFGWNYAIYDGNGYGLQSATDVAVGAQPIKNETAEELKACAACHVGAAPRRGVYSELFDAKALSFNTAGLAIVLKPRPTVATADFKEVSIASLPSFVRPSLLAGYTGKVDELKNKATTKMFAGSFSELMPALEQHTAKTGRLTIVVYQQKNMFAYAAPVPAFKPLCAAGSPVMVATNTDSLSQVGTITTTCIDPTIP